MLKKTPHKRKLKNIVKKIALLFFLFLTSLSILFICYGIFLQKQKVVSPLAFIQHTIKTLTNPDEQKQKILVLLEKHAIETESVVSAEKNTTLVKLKDGKEIIFANNKNFEQQIASLQLIERQLTIEGRRFHRIDFRFDNPVITF